MKVITVTNRKGGSGKTTVAKNFVLLEKEPYLYLGLDTFIQDFRKLIHKASKDLIQSR